jgi:NAD(P)-dependent dehydrogenase (short-subunit alcohol dehydrogenase family)
MEISDKTVIVLGGGSGIGRAGALKFAQCGATVVIGDIDDDAARATAAEIQGLGGNALSAHYDAASEDGATTITGLARKMFGHIDIVWCHAGTNLAGPPEQIPVDRWSELLNVNFLSTVRAFQAFIDDLSQTSGHLAVTSSGLGLFPEDVPGLAAPYAVTKAAQIALARSLAPYLAARNIGISVLVPDQTDTRHARELNTVGLPADLVAASIDPTAMQTPEHVAAKLISGIRDDDFMISTVVDTRARLTAAAERLYAPAQPAADGAVVQYVRIEADPQRHGPLSEALAEMAAQVRAEPGALTYQVSADLSQRGTHTARKRKRRWRAWPISASPRCRRGSTTSTRRRARRPAPNRCGQH